MNVCRLMLFAALIALPLLAGCSGKSARPEEVQSSRGQAVVDDCADVFREYLNGEQGDDLRRAMKDAQGVLILDGLGDVSFLFSIGGGTAVLMARTDAGWTGPVFLGKATGGIGVQAGITTTSGVMLYKSEEDVRYLLETGAVLQARAAITLLDSDYEKNRTPEFWENGEVLFIGDHSGLYAGAGVRGGGLGNREGMNGAYHGSTSGAPVTILYEKQSMPAGAVHLRDLLDMAEAQEATEEPVQDFFIVEETKKDGTEVPSN